ncbi:hypothetical protein NDU88_011520 [Pleurodeles waltl]|uniref:Uncharacterized protein n=1 Tax=Pleurodeles waltl TaxID=8319 RepID=A0AAV7S2I0_PLEWA|nr:hypothetical protein NDU88_011520 [Pleurodeles waltl]
MCSLFVFRSPFNGYKLNIIKVIVHPGQIRFIGIMAERRRLWEQAAAELFDNSKTSNGPPGVQMHTTSSLINQLEKARISELKMWWERTSLTKYIESGRVPRGLRILILPTLGDMDPDLLEEWRMQTADCSTKLMGTLLTQAKRRMDEQITKIEQLTKDLEKIVNLQEVSNQLAKMEERIKNKEEEIKLCKAHMLNKDKLDYEHGRIHTFARKYDIARTKDVSKSGAEVAKHHISADDSSEIGSSADEAPQNKLDFQGEMRLMQMVTPPPGQNRKSGRGSGRRGGVRRRSNQQ